MFEALSQDADNEYVMIDSTIVRAHQHSSGAALRTGSNFDRPHPGQSAHASLLASTTGGTGGFVPATQNLAIVGGVVAWRTGRSGAKACLHRDLKRCMAR